MGTEAFAAERSRQFLYRRFNRLLAEAARLAEDEAVAAERAAEAADDALAKHTHA